MQRFMPKVTYDMHAIRNALAIAHGHTWLALNSLGKDECDAETVAKRLTSALEAMDRLAKLVNPLSGNDEG
jgi:hypothetical protein